MTRVMEASLEEHNQMSTAPMDLVMFSYAMEHTARVARVLCQPGGHVLEVGVGGSGRKSAARLASHMMELDVFSIEISKSYTKSTLRYCAYVRLYICASVRLCVCASVHRHLCLNASALLCGELKLTSALLTSLLSLCTQTNGVRI